MSTDDRHLKNSKTPLIGQIDMIYGFPSMVTAMKDIIKTLKTINIKEDNKRINDINDVIGLIEKLFMLIKHFGKKGQWGDVIFNKYQELINTVLK